MQGDAEVVARLNELLGHELAASETYLVQGNMLADWGYRKLAERIRHESDDERGHAEKLVERILFLQGTVDLTTRPRLALGSSPREMFEGALTYERDVARLLNQMIEECRAKLDAGTRVVLDQLLTDTEMDHILWLETQLRLMDQLGETAYLSEQM